MAMADELTQLRGNLSLAEEGLANMRWRWSGCVGYWTGDKLTGALMFAIPAMLTASSLVIRMLRSSAK